MNQECVRIADQLRRAFHGEAWHGQSVQEILEGLTAEQAKAHPVPQAHSVWELVLHIEAWVRASLASMGGASMPDLAATPKEVDWPPVTGSSSADWESARKRVFQGADEMVAAIEKFGDER